MKITNDNNLQPNAPVRKNRSVSGEGTQPFANVLDKSIGATSTERVQSTAAIQPVIRPIMEVPVEHIFTHTDRMIDAMESYQQLLSDSTIALRDVEPAIQQMKSEFRSLEDLVDETPDAHPMKQIASETLLTAAKEIARFEGGAYVPDGGDGGQ